MEDDCTKFNGIHGVNGCGHQRKEPEDMEAAHFMYCACGFESWGPDWASVGLLMDEHLKGKDQ
jgi:hypothetical protein